LLDLAMLGDETLILEQAALVTLGIALVGVALRLPVGYASSNWRLLVVLLGILMPLMWMVSGLLVYLILGLPFWVSVLVGAIITPTDPAVASSIVAGGVAERKLPSRLRCAISAESGFNDGLALPFVVLSRVAEAWAVSGGPLMGSVSDSVVRDAHCPILIVRE
jgi:sodium/hydrogen antiporter